ncbi:MAG: phage baseplate assembly protein V [Deltaproteobacteria bacterium]|nr:phage baseplate assembly protein V [Deltaproteobacteria bacterium]
MSDLIDVLRSIVRDELRMLRIADLGVVTSVFPHAQGDTHNHECNIKLRESELELRKVPVATPHVGMVSAPRVGDLVLVHYVGGDPNRAVVTGRLYSNEANPPEHGEGEFVLQAPFDGDTSIKIDEEQSVIVTTGANVVKIFKDGNIEVSGEGDLAVDVAGNVELSCTDCAIDASGEINLGTGGDPVVTEGSHRCYYTGAPLVGVSKVKAKL